MPDNVAVDPGQGGSATPIATDFDGTAHHQLTKIEYGENDTQTPVSDANPLPIRVAAQTGSANGRATAGSASSQVRPANARRTRLDLTNRGPSDVWISVDGTSADAATDYLIRPHESFPFVGPEAVNAVCLGTGDTAEIHWVEVTA